MYDYHEDLRIILDNIGHSEEELRKGKQTLLAAVSLLLQREKGQAALPKNVERPYRLRKPSLRVEEEQTTAELTKQVLTDYLDILKSGLDLLIEGVKNHRDMWEEFDQLLKNAAAHQRTITSHLIISSDRASINMIGIKIQEQLVTYKRLASQINDQNVDLVQGIHDVAAQQTLHGPNSEHVKQAWINLSKDEILDSGTTSTIKNMLDYWDNDATLKENSKTVRESVTATKDLKQTGTMSGTTHIHRQFPNQDKDVYLVRRIRAGVNLVDQQGKIVTHYDEQTTKQRGFADGDLIKAVKEHGKYYFKTFVAHDDNAPASPKVVTAKYMVVESPDRTGKLIVRHDINNRPLIVDDHEITYELDTYQVERFKLKKGSIIDLAWYEDPTIGDDVTPERIVVRWVYNIDEIPQSSITKKKTTKQQTTNSNKKNSATDMAISIGLKANLKLDLHSQRVGVYIGNRQNKVIVEEIIRSYHGHPRILNGSTKSSKKIKREIKNLDMIILVTALASHEVSQPLVKAIKQEGIKFAVSTSLSKRQIAQALYRAENNLPAFEPSNQVIDYPVVGNQNADML
ncbi:DUF2325 domain-containing protein [Limosilactobacillus reuteri]|uniref:DUF2325 domain-containing protein n=1 Tax=Limosilactobacillus reuteri TaxID=1598 RepID=UPI001E6087D8|nr:DUF2325 domain-containing protein [Limosilactobacillus reuteri]MCC4370581.1 DUF2325 domain-containing protein [Limosilactobacillus reuteri]MCC4371850.1 DUF2325 domain-containing protein [Limosilactobacillus reuteri]MCC4509322.1 DUF2325 domain-containing protein [Limosilactobacillus reuteri]MCC4509365.1 DUF2325 domain-containing protein [Limosilactobacillus reuteri]